MTLISKKRYQSASGISANGFGSAHAESVAPVVTTSSMRTIQRPANGLALGLAEAPRARRANAPRTFDARARRSRSNCAVVARVRSRIGAQGNPSALPAARAISSA